MGGDDVVLGLLHDEVCVECEAHSTTLSLLSRVQELQEGPREMPEGNPAELPGPGLAAPLWGKIPDGQD